MSDEEPIESKNESPEDSTTDKPTDGQLAEEDLKEISGGLTRKGGDKPVVYLS